MLTNGIIIFGIQGDKIVSADCDGITKIWDIRMVKEERTFDSGLTSANCAIFDKACASVYVASEDASIKVFNVASGEKEGELKKINREIENSRRT